MRLRRGVLERGQERPRLLRERLRWSSRVLWDLDLDRLRAPPCVASLEELPDSLLPPRLARGVSLPMGPSFSGG